MKVSTEILQILDTNSIENLFVASARFIKKKKKKKKNKPIYTNNCLKLSPVLN